MAIQIVPQFTVSYESWAFKVTMTSPSVLSGVALDNSKVLFVNRELKQATFLSTRTGAGSKLRRYRWRMMASAVLV